MPYVDSGNSKFKRQAVARADAARGNAPHIVNVPAGGSSPGANYRKISSGPAQKYNSWNDASHQTGVVKTGNSSSWVRKVSPTIGEFNAARAAAIGRKLK